MDYARRLKALAAEVSDVLMLVMRVYFEKPRTTVGWKGYINDPHMDDTFRIDEGMVLARQFLLDVNELGLPAGTEALDPISPQYLGDLIAWNAIGARTTESQTHREMSSGLSTPVGFKNATNGEVGVAVNAILSASRPHRFLGISSDGKVSIVHTTGNPYGHLVLRGGDGSPNYDTVSIALAEEGLAWLENIKQPGALALPDSDDKRVFIVTERLITEGSATRIALMGDKTVLFSNAKTFDIDLTPIADRIDVYPADKPETALNIAADLLSKGVVQAVVAGNRSTTAQVIRAGISGVGLSPGVRTVSGSFIMNKDGEKVYLYADCGVVIAPTEKQLIDIASESVKTWNCIFPDIPPVVAFLSFSTKGSATNEQQEKIATVAAKFKELFPDI
jgi:hypothetical protein